NGFGFQRVYGWKNVPIDDWVEMGVGRDIAALGAARGCSDFPEWNRCNASAWNCSRYQLEERCNETDDSDCEGITMELACKASCCLCGADNPASCGAQGGSDELPPWVIPVAAGGGSLLLCFFIGCGCYLRRRKSQ
ncbi:Eukaryotic translation initiation factor 3 subunit E, partial [Durusdinium trenchii]